jgi:hypothetical protein
MKRTFSETVRVEGIEWVVRGDFVLPQCSSFYDPGQELVIEEYSIYLNDAGPAGDIDFTDVLDDGVHMEIVAAAERELSMQVA